MAKITIPDILGMFASVLGINNRFEQVQDEFNNKVLYRDNPGTDPNQMENDLDMNGNDVLNVKSITTSTGSSFVQDIEAGTPNLEVDDDGEGTYTISAVSLGGGDVFRAFSNEFLPGTVQTMPEAVIAGYDVGPTFSNLTTDVGTALSIANTANTTANTANTTAGTALTDADAAQATANSAETKANQNAVTVATKISQSDADTRYVRQANNGRIPVTMTAGDFTGTGVTFDRSEAWALVQDNTMMFGGYILFDQPLDIPGSSTKVITMSTKGLFAGGAYKVAPVFNSIGLIYSNSGGAAPFFNAQLSGTTSQTVSLRITNPASGNVGMEMDGFTWHCFGLSS